MSEFHERDLALEDAYASEAAQGSHPSGPATESLGMPSPLRRERPQPRASLRRRRPTRAAAPEASLSSIGAQRELHPREAPWQEA